MQRLILFLFTAFIFAGNKSFSQKNQIIRSKEDIVFHTPDMIKFSETGKISEFKGVIDRVYFNSSDLKLIDLYQFTEEEVKVNELLCTSYIEKIFSISRSKIYKLKYLRIENSNKGNVCEALIVDRNPVKEDPYIRYVTIGFINAKATVIVFHPVTINDEKISEMKKFWSSLR